MNLDSIIKASKIQSLYTMVITQSIPAWNIQVYPLHREQRSKGKSVDFMHNKREIRDVMRSFDGLKLYDPGN